MAAAQNAYPTLDLVFKAPRVSNGIWNFLTIEDVLNMSVCSRYGASVVLSPEAIQLLVNRFKNAGQLGRFHLTFAHDLTSGMLRRVMNRLCRGTEAVIGVDENTGRVIVDIGSAFNDPQTVLASEVTPMLDHVLEEEEVDSPKKLEAQTIFKYLEGNSYDEYDDFNPRHPRPKGREHRRGDSYFNSDSDMLAGSDLLGNPSLAAAINKLGIAANQKDTEDEPEERDAFALKNKFLNKTR